MLFSKGLLIKVLLLCIFFSPREVRVELQHSEASEVTNAALDALELRSAEGRFYYQGVPYTGRACTCYPNGQLAIEKTFLEGQLHGTYKKWFDDGSLSFASEYRQGLRHGYTTTWWRNGLKRSLSQYEYGVAHGEQWQWYQSGRKFKRIQLVSGQEEGLQQSWRENGKLYNNYEAKNGRIFGLKRANLCYELSEEEIQSSY